MTQTHFMRNLFKPILKLELVKGLFKMEKSFYVKINHARTTCCRMHIDFSMHYDIYHHICCTFHTNIILQECGIQVPPKSLRDFISSVLYRRDDGYIFYKMRYLKGSCFTCGCLQNMQSCVHVESMHEIGNKLVSFRKYKSVTYVVKDGKELKRCELVSRNIYQGFF